MALQTPRLKKSPRGTTEDVVGWSHAVWQLSPRFVEATAARAADWWRRCFFRSLQLERSSNVFSAARRFQRLA